MNFKFEQFEMEHCQCDWCGSNNTRFVFEGPDRLEHLPGTFRVVQCSECGLYRQNPRLTWEGLKYYYPEDYPSHPKLVSEQRDSIHRLDKRYGLWKRLRAVERFQAGGRLLEVGCGTGLFLEEALRSGRWEVVGVEPNERVADYTRQHLRIPIIPSRFSEAKLEVGSFDVAVFWHVFEHLHYPIADLRKTRRLLKPGGWLVLGLPNVESWENSMFGKYWIGWDQPRHLYLFPQRILRTILESEGLRWETARCISSGYAMLNHSLDFWSQSWGDRYPRLRKLLLKSYRSLVGRFLLAPPLWILDRLKLSTVITIFAQKTLE